jgi:hypothetical protein
MADGFLAVLVADPFVNLAQFTFVGEVALILWLLLVGRRKSFRTVEPGPPDTLDPVPGARVPAVGLPV